VDLAGYTISFMESWYWLRG